MSKDFQTEKAEFVLNVIVYKMFMLKLDKRFCRKITTVLEKHKYYSMATF